MQVTLSSGQKLIHEKQLLKHKYIVFVFHMLPVQCALDNKCRKKSRHLSAMHVTWKKSYGLSTNGDKEWSSVQDYVLIYESKRNCYPPLKVASPYFRQHVLSWAFTKSNSLTQNHPATGILALPACDTECAYETVFDWLPCVSSLTWTNYIILNNKKVYLIYLSFDGTWSLSEPNLWRVWMQSCVIKHITPHRRLKPAVIKSNQGYDHETACGNFSFCNGPVRGTASLVIIIMIRDDGRLS